MGIAGFLGKNGFSLFKGMAFDELSANVRELIVGEAGRKTIQSTLLSASGLVVSCGGLPVVGVAAGCAAALGLATYLGCRHFKKKKNALDVQCREEIQGLLTQLERDEVSLEEVSGELCRRLDSKELNEGELREFLEALRENPEVAIARLSEEDEFKAGIARLEEQNREILQQIEAVYEQAKDIREFLGSIGDGQLEIKESLEENKQIAQKNQSILQGCKSTQDEDHRMLKELYEQLKISDPSSLLREVVEKIKSERENWGESFEQEEQIGSIICAVARERGIPAEQIESFQGALWYICEMFIGDPGAGYEERYNALIYKGMYWKAEEEAVAEAERGESKYLRCRVDAAEAVLVKLDYSRAEEHLEKAYKVLEIADEVECRVRFEVCWKLGRACYHTGRFGRAQEVLREGVEEFAGGVMSRRDGLEYDLALGYLVNTYNALGDYREAERRIADYRLFERLEQGLEQEGGSSTGYAYAEMLCDLWLGELVADRVESGLRGLEALEGRLTGIIASGDMEGVFREHWVVLEHRVMYKRGYSLLSRDMVEAAYSLFTASEQLVEGLAGAERDNPGVARARVASCWCIGDVLYQSKDDVAGGLACYEESLGIFRQLVADFGSTAERQRDIFVSLARVGDVLYESKDDVAGGLACYEESLGISRQLVADFGSTAERQRDIALSLYRVGDVLYRSKDDVEGGLAFYEESLGISRQLVADFGSTAERQRDIALSLDRVGDVLYRSKDDVEGGLACYEESLGISRQLVVDFGSTALRQRDISVSLNNVGDVLYESKDDVEGGLAFYEESLGICRQLVTDFGSTAERQRDIAVSLGRVGDVLYESKEYVAALERYREAERIISEVIEKQGEVKRYREVREYIAWRIARSVTRMG